MSNIKTKALEYLEAGLSVIPTTADKIPAINSWKKYQTETIKTEEIDSLFNSPGLGIICGAVSGNLEVIDVDIKYDTTGSLWEDLRGLIEDNLPDIYNSLVIAQTKSGGYHIYYRCSEIAGNLKLANRYTTPEEKEKTYKKEIESGADEEKAKKTANNDKVRVLVETRGEGGYIIAPPSPGYKYIQGEPTNIPTITTEEREILFFISKSFDQLPEPIAIKAPTANYNSSLSTLSPWIDYNQRGDVLGLLESHGWRIVNQRGENINLLRPGNTDSKTSGGFHITKRVLNIFSSSTIFEPGKGYNPSSVFALLECNGDTKEATKKLLSLGYGEYFKNIPAPVKTEKIKVSSVNLVTGVSKVISNPGEALTYDKVITDRGAEITISSPGEATEEILKALELIDEAKIRVYVKEGELPEVRGYTYRLYSILKKYQGKDNYRDIDNLLDEIVITGNKLQPIDSDIFIADFQIAIGSKLGVTSETIKATIERLSVTRDKQQKKEAFNKMLSDVNNLEESGEVDTAIELIESSIKAVKLQDKKTEFSKLLLPTSEKQIREAEESLPGSLDTGYTINGEEFLLPGGAISVIAAPTNHGKTAFLNNLVLNVAERYKDKEFIFFTYEEKDSSIIQYLLNTYVNIDLNSSKKSNRRLLKDYFKTGLNPFIGKEQLSILEEKKAEFFKTYIETGRFIVKYIDYNSQDLIEAITYLHKENKNLGGVFIDYFQLINAPGKVKKDERINTRQEELKYICIKLKDIAVKTGLPLCLAAQFNREVTDLTKLLPTNIGEAGDIERIVNTLIGLWNVEKKTDSSGLTKPIKDEIERRLSKATTGMYVEILKSRDLPTGSYEILNYNGNTGKISNHK
jgi:replicative DNA helicase